METVNEHAILVQCSDMNDSLMSVFFIAYDYLREIMKRTRVGYAISTIRRWELDRSTELFIVKFGSSTSFLNGMIPVISGFLNAC